MLKKITRRLLFSLISLLLISIISFSLMELAPGGPASLYLENPKITRADRDRLATQMGLDKPAPQRYFIWLKNFVQGNMGLSYRTGLPVSREIMSRLPATLTLMSVSFLFSLAVALSIGIYAAARPASAFDGIATFCSFLGISLPSFWFGLLVLFLLAGILPSGGYSTPWFDPAIYPLWQRPFAVIWEKCRYLIMPVLVLSLGSIAGWSRYIRSSMLEEMNRDYIRTARAKGVPARKVVCKHALRNALNPLVTVVCLDLPYLFSGALVTETIFAWPGIGRLFYVSVTQRDYIVLMGIVMITGALVILGNFLADVLYTLLDPRVKYDVIGEENG